MRLVPMISGALCVLLWAGAEARGQAGRYIPVPRIPSGGGGAAHGFPHIPHFPFFGVGDYIFWVVVAIVVLIALTAAGWKLGLLLGQKKPFPGPSPWPSVPQPSVPPLQDLIIQPGEVAEKAGKTTRLLEELARRDPALNPRALCGIISATFTRVQACWEARNYGPIQHLLGPYILADHEDKLRAMRRNREINRIEDLRIQRLELVHVCCPAEPGSQEVTALITFEAKVYFVQEGTGTFLRGSQKVIPYQEFWIFCRHGDSWRLEAIDRSGESQRLTAPNRADGMTDVDRRNTENGVMIV